MAFIQLGGKVQEKSTVNLLEKHYLCIYFYFLPSSSSFYLDELKLKTKCVSTIDVEKFYHTWQNWFKMNKLKNDYFFQ